MTAIITDSFITPNGIASAAADAAKKPVAATRAVLLRNFDRTKLKLLPESALSKEAAANLPKRQRTEPADKKKADEGVWTYDGKAGVMFQFGTGKDAADPNADFLTCWNGACWWHGGEHKYIVVTDKHDTGFAVAAAQKQAAQNTQQGAKPKMPTGKLLAQLSLYGHTKPNSQAQHVFAMMGAVTDAVIDAMCNGMACADGSVYRWLPEGEMTPLWAKKIFKNPFNATPAAKADGTPYDPDVKVKVRYFLKAERDPNNASATAGGHVLSLAAPINDLATGKPLADPFTLLNKFTHGKWIVTLGNVVKKNDTEFNARSGFVCVCAALWLTSCTRVDESGPGDGGPAKARAQGQADRVCGRLRRRRADCRGRRLRCECHERHVLDACSANKLCDASFFFAAMVSKVITARKKQQRTMCAPGGFLGSYVPAESQGLACPSYRNPGVASALSAGGNTRGHAGAPLDPHFGLSSRSASMYPSCGAPGDGFDQVLVSAPTDLLAADGLLMDGLTLTTTKRQSYDLRGDVAIAPVYSCTETGEKAMGPFGGMLLGDTGPYEHRKAYRTFIV